MKAQTIILEVIECGMTGEIGLAPQGANVGADDYMADVDGLLIAHDLLEHVNGAEHIGGIGDELEALGAIWYGRGQCGDLTRNNYGSMYSPEENIGSDVARMAREFSYKGFERAVPDNQETGADDTLRYIVARGIHGACKELAYENDCEDIGTSFREYARDSLAFMQAGYLKAEAKYGSSGALNNLFWNVRDAVKPYAEHAEMVGQQYELTITDDGLAHCSEHYEFDEELACDDCGEWIDTDEDTHHTNPQGYTQCADCIAKEQAA